MNKPVVISFVGKIGAGKTTAARYLESKYGFIRRNFKDALIFEVQQNFPDLLKHFSKEFNLSIDELFQVKPDPVRFLMQNYGTEVRRRDDMNYWIVKWKAAVLDFLHQGKMRIVVDDCRFINEAQAVRLYDGKIIRVIREGKEQVSQHRSETEQDEIPVDHVISVPDGRLDVLFAEVDKIVSANENHPQQLPHNTEAGAPDSGVPVPKG